MPGFFRNSPSPNQIPTALLQRGSDIVQSATPIPNFPEVSIVFESYGERAPWAKEDRSREMPIEPKSRELNVDIVVWRNIREAHHQSVACHATEFLQCIRELREGKMLQHLTAKAHVKTPGSSRNRSDTPNQVRLKLRLRVERHHSDSRRTQSGRYDTWPFAYL